MSHPVGTRDGRSARAPTVTCNPEIMGGVPAIRGTRIPVDVILLHVRNGDSQEAIFDVYPSLPAGGVTAAIAWADAELGPAWRDWPEASASDQA